MKKLLFSIFTVFCCLFTTNAFAQCEVEVIFVGFDDGGAFIAETPTVFCDGEMIQIPVATISGADASYTLTSNVGTFDSEFIDDGFIAYLNVTQDDIDASGGSFEVTFTGVTETDCVGTISSTFEAIGVPSVYGFCCADPTWIDASGEAASATFAAQPFCVATNDTIAVAFTVFGNEATTYTVTASNGIFNTSGEGTAAIEFDGASSGIEFLLLVQEDLDAIAGGDVTIDIVNDNDAACANSLVFSLDGLTSIGDFCNAVAPPANDVCGGAIALSEGENGPFNNSNSTVDADEPESQAGCYFSDDVFQATIWFTFYGSGSEVTITSNNSCAGITTANDDTQFAIYEGSCNGQQVACNDDIDEGSGNYLSTLTISTDNGQLYYLLVDGYNGTAGDFCLEVTGSGAPCEVTGPTISAGVTSVCQNEMLEVTLDDAGSGAGGVMYMLTDFNGSQDEYSILAGPQAENMFDVSGLAVGDILGWAISVEDMAESTDGTIGGIQGCYELSNPIFYSILDANGSDCVSSTIKLDNVQEMNVFPQPVADVATLSLTVSNAEQMNLQIVDLTGKVISSQELFVQSGANQIELDVTNFASGIYFVQVSTDAGMATTKLIKK